MIKEIIKLRRFNREPEINRAIVFFSEGRNYWNTFAPAVNSLIKKGQSCSYISMDPGDPGLNTGSNLVSCYFIGKGIGFIIFMNMLKARVVVMTTPGLQVLTIKRSPGVNHYVHIVHSAVNIGKYRKYAFDHFDTVMCSGEHQIEDIRKLETLRNSKKKNLLKTGCAYLDVLAEKIKTDTKETTEDRNTVLLAPTWDTKGFLSRFGSSIIIPLLKTGYNVIVRPHPQQLRSEMSLLKSLQQETTSYDNISWDDNPLGHESFKKADIMISDVSGVIFDFAFVYKKPVISLNFEQDVEGYEQEDLKADLWDRSIRENLGALVDEHDIPRIADIVEKTLRKPQITKKLTELREQFLFNFGSVGEIASEQLLEIAGLNQKN